jgi:Uncharacterized conserved protein (COG2071)
MNIPAIKGIIDRRILINFTVDPDIISRIISKPFRPRIYCEKAIVGICLIRLKKIRPKGFPDLISLTSENGAHRIAVEWDEKNEVKRGVFIPRRDTSSKINSFVGGRIFPGKHFHAEFDVKEGDGNYHIAFKSSDGTTIAIDACKSNEFNPDSVFRDLETASEFFQGGAVGYSPSGSKFEGLELRTYKWQVEPLTVSKVQSSFFEDESVFPKGSVQFDNALLMTGIEHEWHSVHQINQAHQIVHL